MAARSTANGSSSGSRPQRQDVAAERTSLVAVAVVGVVNQACLDRVAADSSSSRVGGLEAGADEMASSSDSFIHMRLSMMASCTARRTRWMGSAEPACGCTRLVSSTT